MPFSLFADRHNLLDQDCVYLNSLIEKNVDLNRDEKFTATARGGDFTSVVLEGHVAKFKMTFDGRQQIVALYQQGDLPEVCFLARSKADAEIVSIGYSRLALIRREQLTKIALERKTIAAALWREIYLQQSIANEWIVSLGQRTAEQRVAHFFLERLNRHLKHHDLIRIPLKQRHIAAVIGITDIHLSRILNGLKRKGLMQYEAGVLKVFDSEALAHLSGFDGSYLTDPLKKA